MALPAPTPRTAPNVPTYRPPDPFGYKPTTPDPFKGTAPTSTPMGAAPTATPYGTFTAPDPNQVANSPYFQFRFGQGQKAIERGAAAHGTLLTGGLQSRLAEFGQGLASEEADKDYQRALATYGTNRATNAQNYGQSLSSYGADAATNAQNFAQDRATFADTLSGYKTNADVTQNANAQGLQSATAGYDRNAATGRTLYEDAAADAMRRNDVANTNNDRTYQTQILQYQLQQEEARRQSEMQMRQSEMQMREQDRVRASQEQQMREFDQRNRENSARQNAATNAVKPALPYLPYPQKRRAGA